MCAYLCDLICAHSLSSVCLFPFCPWLFVPSVLPFMQQRRWNAAASRLWTDTFTELWFMCWNECLCACESLRMTRTLKTNRERRTETEQCAHKHKDSHTHAHTHTLSSMHGQEVRWINKRHGGWQWGQNRTPHWNVFLDLVTCTLQRNLWPASKYRARTFFPLSSVFFKACHKRKGKHRTSARRTDTE